MAKFILLNVGSIMMSARLSTVVRTRTILRTYLNDRRGIRGTASKLGYSKKEVARVVMNYISNQHAARGVSTQDVVLRV